MKIIIASVSILFTVTLFSCRKEPKPGTSSITGQWKYESNVGGGCTDLIGTVWEIKNTEATVVSVPTNPFQFKAGEKC